MPRMVTSFLDIQEQGQALHKGTSPFSLLGAELPQESAARWEMCHSPLQEQRQGWRVRSFPSDSPSLLGISTLYFTAGLY